MTEFVGMPSEEKKKLYELVKQWGMLRVLRDLAGLCEHWATHFDPSEATMAYRDAADNLDAIADDLERVSDPS